MGCPTITALVSSGGCLHCEQHGYCEVEALVLRQMSASMKFIKVKDACELYRKHALAADGTKDHVDGVVKRLMRHAGLDFETSTLSDLLIVSTIDRIVEAMREEKYADMTIIRTLDIIRMFDSKVMRRHYRAAGYDMHLPLDIDWRKYRLKTPPVQSVSLRSITKLRQRMAVLKASKDPADRSVFLYLFMYLVCSMSHRDIVDAKWGWFVQGLDGKYYKYTRHKTGKGAGDLVPLDDWLLIEDMVGQADEYIIPSGTHGRGVHSRTLSFVARRASKECRAAGITGTKSNHALRKYGAQVTRVTLGGQAAARRLGDTMRVTDSNYAGETSRLSIMGVA